jgi:hypothetical protein
MGSFSSATVYHNRQCARATRSSRVELIAIEFASVDATVRSSTLALFCIRFSDAHELRPSVYAAGDSIGFAARVSLERDSVVAFDLMGLGIDAASEGAAASRRRDESPPVALDHGLTVHRAGERALSLARVVGFTQRRVAIEPSFARDGATSGTTTTPPQPKVPIPAEERGGAICRARVVDRRVRRARVAFAGERVVAILAAIGAPCTAAWASAGNFAPCCGVANERPIGRAAEEPTRHPASLSRLGSSAAAERHRSDREPHEQRDQAPGGGGQVGRRHASSAIAEIRRDFARRVKAVLGIIFQALCWPEP